MNSDKFFNINFELFYESEQDIKDEMNDLRKDGVFNFTQVDVFDLSGDEHINYYKALNSYSKKILNPSEVDDQYPNQSISKDLFKSAYRKFFNTRLHSKVFTLPKVSNQITLNNWTEEYIIATNVNFIRGPKTVVLANIVVHGVDVPNEEIVTRIKSHLQDKLPRSSNGKITPVTPVKISSVQSSYIIPFKKLMPRIAPIRVCKRLDNIIEDRNKQIFEYKWIQLKTGVIIVHERFGELINPITGNKIDPMYIENTWSAFDTDVLLHILDKPSDISIYKGCSTSEQIAQEVLWQYEKGTLDAKTINDRVCSYYGRRYNFINFYEKLRASKRALSMMGKDVLD